MAYVAEQHDFLGVEGIGRAFIIGSAIGFVVIFATIALITRMAGADWAPAVAVGAFAALWGGPGFGGMLGLILSASRTPK